MYFGKSVKNDMRELKDLTCVGKRTLDDLKTLGIHTIEDLKTKDPESLYDELRQKSDKKVYACRLYFFSAVIAQAQDPNLTEEKKQWHYYSKLRKKQK